MIPESQNIEYKQSWSDDYLKTIAAFANTKGGKLFLGFDDAGIVVGINNSKKLMEDLPNKLRNYLGIVADIILHKEKSNHFIEISVKSYNVAISFRSRYYIRAGSTTTELTGNSLNEFLIKKSGRTWDDITEERADLNDIDEKEVERFIRIAEKTNRLPDIEGLALIEILEKLRLTENNKLKRAAVLLFGKDPAKFYPNIKVKIGRFGKSDDDLLYEEIEEGNIFYLLRNVILQLNRKFFKNPIEFEGLQRIVKGEYPVAALREMLLNALIHKEYSGGSTIQIKVYDNKITVWNQGVLPPQLNSELLKVNHPSVPRNPFIADVFYMSGYIDIWGRGTLKIFATCKEAGLPEPEIVGIFGGVSTTLFAIPKEKSEEKSEEVVGEMAEEIMELMEKTPRITIPQIASKINVTTRSIEREIEKLKKQHKIERVGSKKTGIWKVIGGTNTH